MLRCLPLLKCKYKLLQLIRLRYQIRTGDYVADEEAKEEHGVGDHRADVCGEACFESNGGVESAGAVGDVGSVKVVWNAINVSQTNTLTSASKQANSATLIQQAQNALYFQVIQDLRALLASKSTTPALP